MAFPSALFCFFLSLALVSGHLHKRPGEQQQQQQQQHLHKRPAERDEDKWANLRDKGPQTREQRSQTGEMLKVLDLEDDYDEAPDSNGEYSNAFFDAGPLPDAFTICSALGSDTWDQSYTGGDFFTLNDDDGARWGYVNLFPAQTYSEIEVMLGPAFFVKYMKKIFFPYEWMNLCLSVDLVASKVVLVADGEFLGEEEFDEDEDEARPTNLEVQLGYRVDPWGYITEDRQRLANVNVFDSVLTKERMIAITTAGGEECGALGNLVNWEETEWTMFSAVKWIEMDRQWSGPCRREPTVQAFTADFEYHQDCMQHCQKISNGRSPALVTEEQWTNMTIEIDLITRERIDLPWMWLSVTEGDHQKVLALEDHWPETEVVDGKTVKMEAVEAVWRDYYTGERIGDWAKPWFRATKDTAYGETFNCMLFYTDVGWDISWAEWMCKTYEQACPCSYPTQPLLRFRGLCSKLADTLYAPKQLPDNPGNMMILGQKHTKIQYNATSGTWLLTDTKYGITAESRATHLSYILGKHEWTISGDEYECSKGVPYTTMLKMTGCKEEGEFTCDDGQCIKIEERCNQVPDCRDKSDENECNLIMLESNYNKNIPPIRRGKDGSAVPADVSISITLMKVVEIEEVDHSIHLQFQIHMMWKENRVRYQNLKDEVSLNALTLYEIEELWLPLVIYDNTDQKESTRLGAPWEWLTRVAVVREGNFTRSGIQDVDEAEIFEGSGNNLTMTQTYTLEIQCEYKLQRYPFDTQECSMRMGVESQQAKTMQLSANKVLMMDVYSVPKDFDNLLPEDIDLTMFSIQNLTLFKQKQLVIMSIVLKRKVATELLTTYLPTILLLLITFITVFFDKALFGDAIAVNLTIMLVMTTIFTSKIEELPPTSDMKMIDIWLIFCLIVPFLEVILRTAIECFTCDCQVCEPKENDENDKAGDGEVGEKNDPGFLHGSSTLRVGTGVKVAPKQVHNESLGAGKGKCWKQKGLRLAQLTENWVLPLCTLVATVAYTFLAVVFYNSGATQHTTQ